MAGPNVEVFKFGLYMFFPLWVMYKFGDPEWYNDYVKPYGEMLWPAYETTNKPPRTESELRSELARLRAEREARTALKIEEGKLAGRLPREEVKEPSGPARTAIEYYRARAAASQVPKDEPPTERLV